jgi:ACR3 family arsenite transporter
MVSGAAWRASPGVYELTCDCRLDRLLTPLIVVAMILGVVIGRFAPNVNENLSKGDLHGVSAPLTVGLLVMMWPILTKVRYEEFPRLLHTRRLWLHVALSLVLNWLLAPFLMLALAWACLPDLPGYRTGVIMVGVARCIAMVMIWTQSELQHGDTLPLRRSRPAPVARGESNMCAVIVIVNSLLQIVLFAPLSLLFINVISGEEEFELNYSDTAIAVVIVSAACAGVSLPVLTRRSSWVSRSLPAS